MNRVFYKIFVSTLVAVLVLSPLSGVLRTVSATGVWTQLTNNAFSEDTDRITHMTYIGEDVIFTVSAGHFLDLYATNGEDTSLITTNLEEDNANNEYIKGVAAAAGQLYVSVGNSIDGDQLYSMFSSTADSITFQDITNEIPDPIIYIDTISSYGDSLFVWADFTVDGDGSAIKGYSISSGTATEIANATDFGMEDLFGQDLTTTLDDQSGALYISLYAGGNTQIWEYADSMWSQMGASIPVQIVSLAVYDDTLYATTANGGSGFSIFKFGEGSWVEDVAGGLGDSGNSEAKLVIYQGDLYAFTTRYSGGHAQVFKTSGTSWTNVSNFIGVDDVEEGQEEAWTTSVLSVGFVIFVGTGWAGEGPYHATLWMYSDIGGDVPIDGDDDGVTDANEAVGPNSGDANGDMVTDATQPNVTSFTNFATGHPAVLESNCDLNQTVSMSDPSLEFVDHAFTYPVGLMNFELECTVGETATITQYFYDNIDASLVVARKYDSNTHTYTLIPGATVSNVTIGGQSVLKIVYQITDGGVLDEDGLENGVIVDPSGPALNSVLVPNTGLGGIAI